MLRLKILTVIFVIIYCVTSFADEIDDFITDSKSEDSRVRADYAELLGNYKGEKVFNRLIELAQDKDSYVRWKAADSLVKLGDKRAILILEEVIVKTKGEKDLREYPGEALYKLGDKSVMPFWIKCLDEQNPWLTELFVRAMVEYDYRGKEASEILIKDLASRDDKLKICAAYALAFTEEPRAYDGLLKLLVDSSLQVRQMAILALGHIGNKEATPYLLLTLDDENEQIRIVAYHSLYNLADPRAVFGIIDALNKEKSDYLRQYAVVVLGKLKDNRAVPALLSILDEKRVGGNFTKMGLKADTVKALGEIGDKSAKERLERFFKEMTSRDAPNFSSGGSGGGGRGDISPYIPFLDKSFPLTPDVSNFPMAFQEFSEDRVLSDTDFKNDMGVIIKKAILKIDSLNNNPPQPEFTRADYDKMTQAAKTTLGEFKPLYFDSLVDQLKNDKDTWKRVKAAKDLGASKDKKAVPYLIEALNDPDKYVQGEAAHSLVLIGDEAAIPPLKEKLKSKEELERKAAAGAIASIADQNNDTQLLEEILLGQNKTITCAAMNALGVEGKKNCIPYLVKQLHNDDKEIRKTALWTLNRAGAKEAAPDLHFLLDDKDPEIRIETIRVLGYFHDASAIDKLIQMYDKEDVQGKSAILSTFASLKDPRTIPLLKKAMHDENEQIKFQATEIQQSLAGTDSLVSLDELKSNLESGDLALERNAVESLYKKVQGPADKEAWLLLNSALKHKDIRIRRLAALKIGGGNPEAFPILIDMLNDKKLIEAYVTMNKAMNGEIKEPEFKLSDLEEMQEVQGIQEAISTLGIYAKIYGFPEVKGTFVKLLSYDLDDFTKDEILQGLGEMGDKETIKDIKPFLNRDGTKNAAAITMGRLGDKSVLPLLVERLDKKMVGMDSYDLCQAFAGIGSPAVSDLIKALDSPSVDVKGVAITSLGWIGDKSATPYLAKLINEDDPKTTGEVVIALGNLGDKSALPVLIGLFNSKKIDLKKEIYRAFEDLADPTVKSILIEAAKGKDIDPQSRRESIRGLGKIKDDEVIAFLEDLFNKESGEIKLNAAYALCKEGRPKYQSYLEESLRDQGLYDPASSMLIDLKGEAAIPIIEASLKDKPDVNKKFLRSCLEQMVLESKKRASR